MPAQPKLDPATVPHKTLWAWTAATFFGAGLLRPGPGTYGSLAAAALWLGVAHLTTPTPLHLALATLAAAALATAIGIPAATRVAQESGREDPGLVVIDEAAGQWIALLATRPDLPHALIALLLFRLFDILKPPPVRQLERLPAGLGIMADDLAAGVLALLCTLLLNHFLPH